MQTNRKLYLAGSEHIDEGPPVYVYPGLQARQTTPGTAIIDLITRKTLDIKTETVRPKPQAKTDLCQKIHRNFIYVRRELHHRRTIHF